jgi:hypothetical protein
MPDSRVVGKQKTLANTLLQGCGALEGNGLSVTGNCNGVTEFSNEEQSSNRVAFSEREMVRSPRFEPGSSAWQADVLDQTRLRPHIHENGWSTTRGDVRLGL